MRIGKNKRFLTRLLPLVIILTGTIGAGLADMAFPEVVPSRPYTATFQFAPVWQNLTRSSIMADILVVSLAVMLIASLIAAIANRTTGILIAHTGGPTVNTNLTGSPGVGSTLPLYPLIFAFLGLIVIVAHLRRQEAGV